MSLKNRIKSFSRGLVQVFASVEVVRRSDAPDYYNFLLLKQEKGTINILEKKSYVEGLDALSDIIRKKIPIVLNISGSGVLLKKLEYNSATALSHDQVIRSLLPNANPDDFLLEQHQEEDSGKIFCALIRKNIVQKIVSEWSKQGAFIVDIGLGIFMVKHILPLMGSEPTKINIQEYKLLLKDNQIVDYTKMKNKISNLYEIGGEELEGELLPVLANAFRYFVLNLKANSWDKLIDQRNEFRHYKMSSRLAKVLTTVFVLLLALSIAINYVLSDKMISTDIRLASSQKSLRTYRKLLVTYDQKKEVLKALGIDQGNYISVLIDKVAEMLPSGIYLTGIQYNPRIKRPKGNELFTEQTMVISGKSSNAKDLYKWINKIGHLKRITRVKLSNYNFIKDDGLADFDITISIEN